MKCWVFDLDGTLVDSSPQYFDILKNHFGFNLTADQRMAALHEPADQFLQRFFEKEYLDQALKELTSESIRRTGQIRLYSEIQKILFHLRERNLPVCIWTNRDMVTAQHILDQNDLHQSVEFVVSGSCVKYRKPHPEGLKSILEKFQVQAHETTVVGDHDVDMLGARALGARAIRAHWHGRESLPVSCDLSHFQFMDTQSFGAWVLEESSKTSMTRPQETQLGKPSESAQN